MLWPRVADYENITCSGVFQWELGDIPDSQKTGFKKSWEKTNAIAIYAHKLSTERGEREGER